MSFWKSLVVLALCPPLFSAQGAAPTSVPSSAAAAFAPGEAVSPVSASRGGAVWIENRGQWPGFVRFAGNVAGQSIFLESDALVLDAPQPGRKGTRVAVRMVFEDACADAVVEGLERREGRYNFFIGNDPAKWRGNVPGFDLVRFRGLYPGIDLVVNAKRGRIKYDLIVQPGADLSQVVLRVQGASTLRPMADDGFEIETPLGLLVHSAGLSWQTLASGEPRFVETCWSALGPDRFTLAVPQRDPSLLLVIDPELTWSTYLGDASGTGVGDGAGAVTTDARGDVIVVGGTDALGFPQTPGTYQSPHGTEIPFVTKFRGNTGAMVFSSLIGGTTNSQRALAVTTDSQGRVTVGGYTGATDFPTTPNAFDPDRTATAWFSGFVSQFTVLGDDLVFSTYIEGPQTGGDVRALQAHPAGGVVIGGVALGQDFPTTPGAFQTQHNGIFNDGFIAHLNATGTALLWSTFLGGSGGEGIEKMVVDETGFITVAGVTGSNDFPTTAGAYQQSKSPSAVTNLFVSRLNAQASALIWSTYLGGSYVNEYDGLGGIGVDASGSVTIGGTTNSPSFPTTPGVLKSIYPNGALGQGFITRLDPLGQYLVYSTFLGDSIASGISSLTVDASGVPFLSAGSGPQFPVTPGAYDTTHNGNPDIVVAHVSPTGTKLYYSTFLGGPTTDIGTSVALTNLGRVTVVGYSYAPGGYPTTPGAYQPLFAGGQSDAVITNLDLLLQGVELYGSGTPSCHSPLTANATEMPQAGAASFGLYLSGAPGSSRGLCLISTAASASGVPYFNATLWLAPASIVRRFAVLTDAVGFAETAVPLGLGTSGLELWAQYLMRNAPDCPAGGLVASPAVHLTVQ